jgi:predicted permease
VTATFRAARFSTGLVVLQCAVSVALVASAGLMLRSAQNLAAVSLGFEPDGLVKGALFLSAGQFGSPQERNHAYGRMIASVRRAPGVAVASLTSAHPLRLASRDVLVLGDQPAADINSQPAAADIVVTSDYFSTLRVQLLAGRYMTEADREGAPLVGIINRSFAERYSPGENAIGKRVKVGGIARDGPWVTVVGVVENIPEELNAVPVSPALFRPLTQVPSRFMFLMVRGHGDDLAKSLQKAISAVEPAQPLTEVESMAAVVASASWTTRFLTSLLAAAAGLGLALAALGLYGLITFLVAQQKKEFAVRCALGATPRDIRRTVFAYGRTIVVPGLGLGVGAAILIGQFFGGLVVGVSTLDPITIALACATLLATTALACYLPARTASKAAPASLLRIE